MVNSAWTRCARKLSFDTMRSSFIFCAPETMSDAFSTHAITRFATHCRKLWQRMPSHALPHDVSTFGNACHHTLCHMMPSGTRFSHSTPSGSETAAACLHVRARTRHTAVLQRTPRSPCHAQTDTHHTSTHLVIPLHPSASRALALSGLFLGSAWVCLSVCLWVCPGLFGTGWDGADLGTLKRVSTVVAPREIAFLPTLTTLAKPCRPTVGPDVIRS